MTSETVRRFDEPDETTHFELGRVDTLQVAGLTLGLARYEPGWRWSTHVGALSGQRLCHASHVGIVLGGRLLVEMADGATFEIGQGDVFAVGPGHDSAVIGDEPYESLHLAGVNELVASASNVVPKEAPGDLSSPSGHIEHHLAPEGMAAGNGYSHAVSASGRLLAIAGQVAMDTDSQLVGPGDPEAQVERVFENLGLALVAAGATFADVVKFGIFVTDISILPIIREVRDRHVDQRHPPASTAVQVVALFRPGYLVEIEALAVVRA